jgi:hypothetical protein
MIIYGSPRREIASAALLAEVRRLAAMARAAPGAEATRTLLVALGELEQGVLDAAPITPVEPAAHRELRLAAQAAGSALYLQQAAPFLHIPEPDAPARTAAALRKVVAGLARIAPDALPARLTVHLAEGFAFYNLYPEQYLLSLRESPLWELTSGMPVIVAGIRSIGTALAAVVTGALAARGCRVQSFTVRPGGHPYQRTATLAPWQQAILAAAGPSPRYLVVDEGPGLSGSSLAAGGQAFRECGVPPDRIHFVPAHSAGPGSPASDSVLALWAQVHIHTAPPGSTLPFDLPDWPVAWRGRPRHPAGAGLPPVPLFERPAWVVPGAGAGSSTLLSFAGLGPHGATLAARVGALADAGFAPPPAGWSHGYLATPDRPTERLCTGPVDSALLARLGAYLARAALVYHEPGDPDAALDELLDMLYWNTWEALGEPAADGTRRYSTATWRAILTAAPLVAPPPGLRPDEWGHDARGVPVPALPLGRLHGHPLPARADFAWSLAALSHNFALDPPAEAALLAAYRNAGGAPLSCARRHFYRLAYAAFAAGFAKLSADAAPGAAHGWAGYAAAVDRLRAALAQPMPGGD